MDPPTRKGVQVPAAHLPEFRQRAVKLARAGHTLLAKPVKDLRISESCLRNSMAQADADDNGSATRGDGKVRVTRGRVAPGWSRRDRCPLAAGGRTGTRMPASLPAAGPGGGGATPGAGAAALPGQPGGGGGRRWRRG